LSYISSGKASESTGKSKEILTHAANYNEQIAKTIGDSPLEVQGEMIDKTIDHFAVYDFGFDAPEFKTWLKENPGKISPNSSIGDYLQERFSLFKKTHPSKDLTEIASTAPDAMRKIAQECKESLTCNEEKIGNWFTRKFEKTCVGKNSANQKKYIRSMFTSLAISNLGLIKSAHDHPQDDFSYDIMVNNIFWAPIMTERGCLNTTTDSKIILGEKINYGQPTTFTTKMTNWGKYVGESYATYMSIAPLSNATYLAFNLTGQLVKGQKKFSELNPAYFKGEGKKLVSMVVYDAAIAVPRIVIFTDPLYYRALPGLKSGITSTVKSKVATEIIYTPLEWGTRVFVASKNTDIFHWWQRQSDQLLGTKSAPEKKPIKKGQ